MRKESRKSYWTTDQEGEASSIAEEGIAEVSIPWREEEVEERLFDNFYNIYTNPITKLPPSLIKPWVSMPHSQRLPNNPYAESNQHSSSNWSIS